MQNAVEQALQRMLLPMNRMVQVFKAMLLISSLGLLLNSYPAIYAQEDKRPTPKLSGIPASIRSSLLERIQQFVEAQRNGEWDKVAGLLGEFRDNSYRRRYTDEHKECLVEQMKSSPMIKFTPMGAGHSTEILSKPLSRKWWYIRGEAEFRATVEKVQGQTTIVAYRHGGEWFLTPSNYDEEWKRSRISSEDLAADLSQYLRIEIAPDCPLEIADLSVKIHPKYRSLRLVSFKLRNKTRKGVDGLGFRIEKVDGSGSMSSGMPFNVKPGEVGASPGNITYSGYVYYCEGESYNRFLIDWVSFADGSEWKPNRRRANRKRGQ